MNKFRRSYFNLYKTKKIIYIININPLPTAFAVGGGGAPSGGSAGGGTAPAESQPNVSFVASS
jgi:hypothetical protein